MVRTIEDPKTANQRIDQLQLTEDTEKIIARSVARTTEYPKTANQRIDQLQPSSKEPPTKVIGMKDMIPNITLPSIDPEQLIGYTFTAELTEEI